MKKNKKIYTEKQRIEELFTVANQLFSAAKTLSEYHTAEIKRNMVDAISYAKTVANEDIVHLKSLQDALLAEATKRIAGYQVKVKSMLDEIGGKPVDKHLKQARTALADWRKDTKNKVPTAALQLGQLTQVLADIGAKALKEGHKLVHSAADKSEKNPKKTAKKENKKVKKAVVKKVTETKVAVKKTVAKKTAVKKSTTNDMPLS
jgi:hypothetical protein